nr:uncharacterized protein LOC113828008 [Penaeus vannamei]
MQISGKAKVVLLALLFCLYWSGFLSFAVRVVASALVSRLSAFESFVRGQDAAKEDVRAAAKEAVKRDTEDMAGKMEDMISKMEKMVEDTDLAEMNSEEMKKTFGKLYDLFPMMDTLFERVLNAGRAGGEPGRLLRDAAPLRCPEGDPGDEEAEKEEL